MLALKPNDTSAVPMSLLGTATSSGELICTVQLSGVTCTQFSVTVCMVPRASYTSMSEEIGAAAVAVPAVGVAGRLADRVTSVVATGL